MEATCTNTFIYSHKLEGSGPNHNLLITMAGEPLLLIIIVNSDRTRVQNFLQTQYC